jgi:hypothetical protein
MVELQELVHTANDAVCTEQCRQQQSLPGWASINVWQQLVGCSCYFVLTVSCTLLCGGP